MKPASALLFAPPAAAATLQIHARRLALLSVVAFAIVAATNTRNAHGSDVVFWVNPETSAIYNTTQSGPIATPAAGGASDSDIAVDSLGNIYTTYYPNSGPEGVLKISPDGQSSSLLGAVTNPDSVAVSPGGQVYVSNLSGIESISQTGVVSSFYNDPDAILAVDRAGDVFATTATSILEITLGGIASTFAALPSSLGILSAIGVDPSGNVYVDDTDIHGFSNGGGEIYKIAPGGYTIVDYVSASNPTHGMAVGNTGDVYTNGVMIAPNYVATPMAVGGGTGIAVLPTPEPSSWVMSVIGAAALLACGLRKRRARLGVCNAVAGEPAPASGFSRHTIEKGNPMKSSVLSASLASLGTCAFVFLALSARLANADLIDYWPLNNGSGSVAVDTVGGLNGTLGGDAQFVAGGPTGGAVSLASATNDLVDMGNVLPLNNSDFSIVAWINTTSTYDVSVVGKQNTTDVSSYILGLGLPYGGNGTPVFYQTEQNPANYLYGTSQINDGTWHQLVATYQLGGTASLYVDGQLQATAPSNPITPSSADFMIGGLTTNGQPTGYFNGLISGVGVYNTALTAGQVQALYVTPEPGSLALLALGALGLFAVVRFPRPLAFGL